MAAHRAINTSATLMCVRVASFVFMVVRLSASGKRLEDPDISCQLRPQGPPSRVHHRWPS
jgi:hypothetical protein